MKHNIRSNITEVYVVMVSEEGGSPYPVGVFTSLQEARHKVPNKNEPRVVRTDLNQLNECLGYYDGEELYNWEDTND